jgi:hypothetical protein
MGQQVAGDQGTAGLLGKPRYFYAKSDHLRAANWRVIFGKSLDIKTLVAYHYAVTH